MARSGLTLNGVNELSAALRNGANLAVYDCVKEATVNLLTAAKVHTPVAPVNGGKLKQHCYSELPQRSSANPEGTVYYTMNYAPHVEYGHRTVNGGYVNGQYYLKAAVDEVTPEFQEKLKKALKNK